MGSDQWSIEPHALPLTAAAGHDINLGTLQSIPCARPVPTTVVQEKLERKALPIPFNICFIISLIHESVYSLLNLLICHNLLWQPVTKHSLPRV